jgi:hypothetical protein
MYAPIPIRIAPAWYGRQCPQPSGADMRPKWTRRAFDPKRTKRRSSLLRCRTGLFLQRCGRVRSSAREEHMRQREFITLLGGARRGRETDPLWVEPTTDIDFAGVLGNRIARGFSYTLNTGDSATPLLGDLVSYRPVSGPTGPTKFWWSPGSPSLCRLR